ncbi:MAG TPA: hypothetical protein VKJ01_26530 [Candidatus Solibacter sp.]|nr:hypothetical protein [Candidatus Solibacter sp.]
MRVHFCFAVSSVMAGMAGSLHAATTATPSTEGSAAGLLIAGVVLIGIGRIRRRKR